MRSNRKPDYLRVLRFGAVGLLNTAFGYTVILTGLSLGWGDIASNAAGYATGLVIGFLLNRSWTFRDSGKFRRTEAYRYTLTFLVSYCANLAILATARSIGFVESPLAHLAGIGVYSVLFYLGSARYVFIDRPGLGTASQSTIALRTNDR
jgi:putative flippase GtrA